MSHFSRSQHSEQEEMALIPGKYVGNNTHSYMVSIKVFICNIFNPFY